MHAATGDRGYCDIWESSLTVRLLTPHMKTRKYGGEDGTEKFTRKILKLFENYK